MSASQQARNKALHERIAELESFIQRGSVIDSVDEIMRRYVIIPRELWDDVRNKVLRRRS